MKIINKLLLATTTALAVFTFNSCEEGNTVVDEVFDNTTSGIVLRTVNVISNELPIGKADANFSVEVEMQDEQNGALVDHLEVFVSFRDNTVETGETDYDVLTEVMAGTIPSSEFYPGEFGFPRVTYTLTLDEMLSLLSVDSAILNGGDQFYVRFAAVLTDGRSFTNSDNSDTSTGSFFRSPFLYTPAVTCPVESTQFVGDYLIEQTTAYVDGPTLSDGEIVTLAVGSTSVERVFQTANYPLYCATLRDFTIELICGEIKIPTQNSGCACSSGGDWFSDPTVRETYDVNDDSVFFITFTDDTQSDCSAPVQTTYRFTKQ
jgi:hypothetical protein